MREERVLAVDLSRVIFFVRITKIYLGIIPFLIAPLVLIVLMFFFPGIALWLPKVLYG